MVVGDKRSYILTQTVNFLSTCKLDNVLTECTSMQTN